MEVSDDRWFDCLHYHDSDHCWPAKTNQRKVLLIFCKMFKAVKALLVLEIVLDGEFYFGRNLRAKTWLYNH